MNKLKKSVFPITITIIIIIIIVYLFSNLKQPYVRCSSNNNLENNIKINENIKVYFDGRKINKIYLEKNINFGDEYNEKDINQIKNILKKSYSYLDKKIYKIIKSDNNINIVVDANNKETLILNNISFSKSSDNSLQTKIINNTKDSSVITLKVSDNYSPAEFISHMKNNGYTCE